MRADHGFEIISISVRHRGTGLVMHIEPNALDESEGPTGGEYASGYLDGYMSGCKYAGIDVEEMAYVGGGVCG